MLPTDLFLSGLCLSSETDALGFDFIDDGINSGTGVWFGIKYVDGYDIVVFRGSLITSAGILLPDWLRDFDVTMIEVPKLGKVHAGFYKNIPTVIDLIGPHLRGLPIIVTGHSLGAARAVLYTASLDDKVARIVIFGCPRPGTQQLADLFIGKDMTSYKNLHDPVTDAPEFIPIEFPYVDVHEFDMLDCLIDLSLGFPFYYHHEINYRGGIENAQLNASQ